MIKVSEDIALVPINLKDQPQLLELMQRIYPPAYAHYWKDDCSWYIQSQYGVENLERELQTVGGEYYFVRFRESSIGILKTISNCEYTPKHDKKAFKIHRIYLTPSVQGKGIGLKLMEYAMEKAKFQNHELVWLDAMDTHTQAQRFYATLGFEKTKLQYLDFPLLHDEHRPMWYMHKML